MYTYACHEEERSLCGLELRRLFGRMPERNQLESPLCLDPSRSPFLKLRLDPLAEADSLEGLEEQAESIELSGETFKVFSVKTGESPDYDAQREIERRIGGRITGKAEMRRPDRKFGVIQTRGRWILGELRHSEAVWLRHSVKPRSYSTALSTRVARAVANIAVPAPQGQTAIDPCCGIGTVLIEALSMGMNMVGADINPLAVQGARQNLKHFGLPDVVKLADMRTLEGPFDAVVLDLPYNLCSKLPPAERLEMLRSARRLGKRGVILSAEPIEDDVVHAGFRIADAARMAKGAFVRTILYVE